ncbi:MAG: DUF1080 domain-containing protein [Planctomycetaceae bacterium]|nr:DUF1080 domain-containing protein [Planctomycetaceae bacterium]
MRSARALPFLMFLVAAAVPLSGQLAPAIPYAPKQSDRPEVIAADEPGFQPIFDGKTLAGWEGNTTYWRAESGSIVGEILPSTVIKSNTFIIWRGGTTGDFELKLDYRITEGGNSGILYHVTEGAATSWHVAPEMQVLDNTKHPTRDKRQLAGALYDLYAPPRDVTRGTGQWNTARLIVQGNRVEHWLNGVKLVEYEIGSADWQQRVANSKFQDKPEFARATTGHICLQDHSDRVEYRNIKLRPLRTVGSDRAGGQ